MYALDSFFFFFKQKTAYEITRRDWSSDVCSSDLAASGPAPAGGLQPAAQTSATQDAIIGRTVVVGASPAASRRTTVLALTARIAGGESDQRLSLKVFGLSLINAPAKLSR